MVYTGSEEAARAEILGAAAKLTVDAHSAAALQAVQETPPG
jgi:hypothetical protein